MEAKNQKRKKVQRIKIKRQQLMPKRLKIKNKKKKSLLLKKRLRKILRNLDKQPKKLLLKKRWWLLQQEESILMTCLRWDIANHQMLLLLKTVTPTSFIIQTWALVEIMDFNSKTRHLKTCLTIKIYLEIKMILTIMVELIGLIWEHFLQSPS